jgi:predicted RecB family nuclease
LKRIAEAQGQITAGSTKKAEIVAPSDAEMRRLRDLLKRETDLRRQLELARVTATFVPSEDLELMVLVGEKPGELACQSGSTISLAGTPNLSFVIDGVGRFDVNGPVTNYTQIKQDLEQQRLALSAITRQFDTTDPEILEARRQAHAQLNSEIQQAGRALSELMAGQTEEAIGNCYRELADRADQIEATYPAWRQSTPDATALTNDANQYVESARSGRNNTESVAQAAQLALKAAEIELGNLQTTQKAREEGLQNAKKMLAQHLLDGVTDQQRRMDLDDAILEYDSCRLALEEVEAKLRVFPEDPTLALDRMDKEFTNLDQLLQQAERTLLQAETNLSSLADRHPHGQLAEISEQLNVVESELNREKCHTDAIALVRNTLFEVRAEMMKTIAAPVEKAATQYLEQICTGPLAEIRLTHSLAAESVAPIPLSDCTENVVELDRLSGGEREQVFLCTRLALAAELARKEKQMVVLDDVLTCTDGERLRRICDLLQIILLTCHREGFDRLTGANRIDLQKLLGSGHRQQHRRELMYKNGSDYIYSPSDLIGFLENECVTWLDRYNLEFPGELSKDEPTDDDELVRNSGAEHEARILDSFRSEMDVAVIDRSDAAFHKTIVAMRQGRQVIYQARLALDPFAGWSDFLIRVPGHSEFGDWQYEVWDTKLARGMKPYFAIQLCCYSEMLEALQGRLPEHAGIILGKGERKLLRIADYYFYYRSIKRAFLEQQQLFRPDSPPHLPGRAAYRHWTGYVASLLEARDDVSLVANIRGAQVEKLSAAGIKTMRDLADRTLELVPQIATDTFDRLRSQARLQLSSASGGPPAYELLPESIENRRQGFGLLPPPSPSDIAFDIEGYPMVEGGLEYLLGVTCHQDGELVFKDWWAHDRCQEKVSFESFIDWVYSRWKQDPTMHIYHYAPYETTALKRLMCDMRLARTKSTSC